MQILINCSNLHVGGGVAVAASFINCLAKMKHADLRISLLISTKVNENVVGVQANLDAFDEVIVRDFFGIEAVWSGLGQYFRGYDVVFTLFGPAYTLRRGGFHLCGFAQPNIIYPSVGSNLSNNWKHFYIQRIKYAIQKLFFLNADALIVELSHVEVGLKRQKLFQKKAIYVVNSSVDDIYQDPTRWLALELPPKPAEVLRIGVIAKNYPHKNLKILPFVKNILERKFKIKTEIFMTLSEGEWTDCDDDFRSEIVNVGELTLAQCPKFYSSLDAVVFPTLLECFSAVPIEAMLMEVPLFTSDREFMRDICEDYCIYFDPYDAEDIAQKIAYFFALPLSHQCAYIKSAKEHVQRYSRPEKRAQEYLEIIKSVTT